MNESDALALLREIAELGEMSTARVAKRLGLQQSQLQRLLSVLGADPSVGGLDLVEVVPDGARTLLRLTPQGRDLLDAAS